MLRSLVLVVALCFPLAAGANPPAIEDENPDAARYAVEVTTPEGENFHMGDSRFTRYLEERFGRSLRLRFSERCQTDARPVRFLFGRDAGADECTEKRRDVGIVADNQNAFVLSALPQQALELRQLRAGCERI